MGTCSCGYTTNPEKLCNGTHKVVKAVKDDIIEKLVKAGHLDAAAIINKK
jgi:hypothetical protein